MVPGFPRVEATLGCNGQRLRRTTSQNGDFDLLTVVSIPIFLVKFLVPFRNKMSAFFTRFLAPEIGTSVALLYTSA